MKIFSLIAAAVFLCACSSAPAPNQNGAVRTNVDISELNQPNVNSLPPGNTSDMGHHALDINGNVQVVGAKKPADKDAPLVAPNGKPLSRPAPDNSEFQSMMNNQGQPVETRVFKDHPTLVKIERIYVDLKNPVINVYLKNGKKVNVPADKIGNPMQISAAEILNAANAGNPAAAPTKQP